MCFTVDETGQTKNIFYDNWCLPQFLFHLFQYATPTPPLDLTKFYFSSILSK